MNPWANWSASLSPWILIYVFSAALDFIQRRFFLWYATSSWFWVKLGVLRTLVYGARRSQMFSLMIYRGTKLLCPWLAQQFRAVVREVERFGKIEQIYTHSEIFVTKRGMCFFLICPLVWNHIHTDRLIWWTISRLRGHENWNLLRL